MKVIDSDGRLFGAVNIFDFLILLMIIVGSFYLGYRFIYKPSRMHRISQSNQVKFHLKLCLRNSRSSRWGFITQKHIYHCGHVPKVYLEQLKLGVIRFNRGFAKRNGLELFDYKVLEMHSKKNDFGYNINLYMKGPDKEQNRTHHLTTGSVIRFYIEGLQFVGTVIKIEKKK